MKKEEIRGGEGILCATREVGVCLAADARE